MKPINLNDKSIDELINLYKNGYTLENGYPPENGYILGNGYELKNMQEPQIKSLQLDIPIMGAIFISGLIIGSIIFAIYKRKRE